MASPSATGTSRRLPSITSDAIAFGGAPTAITALGRGLPPNSETKRSTWMLSAAMPISRQVASISSLMPVGPQMKT